MIVDYFTSLKEINWAECLPLLRGLFLNLIVLVVILVIYSQKSQHEEFYFTYFSFNILVFFLVYLMAKVTISLEFGFGLFALFSILRYRTIQIHFKEMTYLFLVITVAVVNGLGTLSFLDGADGTEAVSRAEIILANLTFCLAPIILERYAGYEEQVLTTTRLTIDNVQNTHADRHVELKQEIHDKTGLTIEDIIIKRVNHVTGEAVLDVHYDRRKQPAGVKATKSSPTPLDDDD